MLQWLSIAIGYAAEMGAVYGFLSAPPPGSDHLSFLVLHGLSSLVTALGLPRWLPNAYQESHVRSITLFFFAIAFLMPMLGMLALAFVFIPSLRRSMAVTTTEHIHRIDILKVSGDLSRLADPDEAITGVQAAGVLAHAADPEKRLRAVWMTLCLKDHDAVPLLRKALRDAEDDVRLLAYALLENKEQSISRDLHQYLKSVVSASQAKRYGLHRHIAIAYWELVHLGLAQSEILDYYLNEAQEHAENALQLRPEDPGLHFLSGRIELRKGNLDAAERAFKCAEAMGIDDLTTRSYLEEIAFRKQLNWTKEQQDQRKFIKELNVA